MDHHPFAIRCTDGREIVFEGELIARAEGPRDQPAAYGRWHNISVYRRSDDLWIVEIEFGTLCVDESPRTEVETVDRPDDVESVLLLHEPTGDVNWQRFRPRFENDKRRFVKCLSSNYDALVDRVVADMRPHVDAFRTVPPVGESPPRRTRWQGLLHIMGLR